MEGVRCGGSGNAEEGVGDTERKGNGVSVGKTKNFEAKKEKRRRRLILNETDSEDELLPPLLMADHRGDRENKEVRNPKKDSVMQFNKENKEFEIASNRVSKEHRRSWTDYLRSDGGAEIICGKLSKTSLKYREENLTKLTVNERKRCGDDSSIFKENVLFSRKKMKTETSKYNAHISDFLDPSYQRVAKAGRSTASDKKRKRNGAFTLDCLADGKFLQKARELKYWKSREGRTNFEPLDPKPIDCSARFKEKEKERNRSTKVACKMASNLHLDVRSDNDYVDNKRLKFEKGQNCLVGASTKKTGSPCEKPFKVQGYSGVFKLPSNIKNNLDGLEEKYNQRKEKEKGSGSASNSNKNKLDGLEEKCNQRKEKEKGSVSASNPNKNKLDGLEEKYNQRKEKEKGCGSASNSNCKKAFDPSLESPKRSIGFLEKSNPYLLSKSSSEAQKGSKVPKRKAHDIETGGNAEALRVEATSKDVSRTEGIEAREKNSSSEMVTMPASKKAKKTNKKGIRTEKQLLCDQLKNILLSAGWKIDYRPRRTKDYNDAVYVSPSGTEHWSITKAYYAFQGQLKCSDSFSGHENERGLHVTNNGNDLKIIETNSLTTLIPLEALSILKRKRVKKNLEGAADEKVKGSGYNNVKKVDKTKFAKDSSAKEKHKASAHKGKLQNAKIVENSSTCSSVKGEQNPMESKLSMHQDSSKRGRKSKKHGSALLARSSSKGSNADVDDFVPYTGKRTLLSWLIDLGILHEKMKVEYVMGNCKRTLLTGWITRDGILCSCCSKILAASKFEIHAGSKLCKPLENIFVDSGNSLLQCLLDAWDKEEAAEERCFICIDVKVGDPNDDTCGICGDGGDLICCDGCPSTFHQCCLDMPMLPLGDWHCPSCSCRYCGLLGGSTRGDEDINDPLLSCSQCERKYHQMCIPKMDAVTAVHVDSNIPDIPFCGKKCEQLFIHLQKLLGMRNCLDARFSWRLVRRFGKDFGMPYPGLAQKAVCNSNVAVAAAVMNECFYPIIDQRSGIDVIRNVIYNCGSNFSRLNYSSFFAVVLERGDEIISVASIRLRGTRIAEMPFIGTRDMYRRQGMCRRLLNAIELVLSSLGVEMLVIPAISELLPTWTGVFGFKPLEESHMQEMKSLNMLVFPGTDMLQKNLSKCCGNIASNREAMANDLTKPHGDAVEMASTSLKVDSANLVSENSTSDDASKVVENADAEPDLHFGGTNGEKNACDDELWNTFSTCVPDEAFARKSKSAPDDKLQELENQSLVTTVEDNLHSFGDSSVYFNKDNCNVRDRSGNLEPQCRSSGASSVHCTSEGTSSSPDYSPLSGPPASPCSAIPSKSTFLVRPREAISDASSFLAFHAAQHMMDPQVNDIDATADIAAVEPIGYTFCDETVQCASEHILKSFDAMSQV